MKPIRAEIKSSGFPFGERTFYVDIDVDILASDDYYEVADTYIKAALTPAFNALMKKALVAVRMKRLYANCDNDDD